MKKNESGFAHMALLAVVVLVLVAGIGVLVAKKSSYVQRNSELTQADSTLVDPLPADLLGVPAMKDLAAREVADSALTSIELENEKGVYLYKLTFANGTVLYFDARSGAKVNRDAADAEKSDDTLPAGFVAGITFDRARQIALAAKSGGVISKIELEVENGTVVYSVRFTDGTRIDVSATDGSVVKNTSMTKPAGDSSADDTSEDTPNSSDDSSSDSNSGSGSSDDSGSHSSDSGSGSSGSSSDD